MFRMLAVGLVLGALALPAQRIDARAVAVRAQTDSTATLVVSWVASNADSVRLAYSTGTTRTRVASRRVDTLVIPKAAAAQTVTVTFTPIRRTAIGSARTASVVVSARPVVEPPPTVDSVRVDTATASVVAPPVVPPATGAWGANRPGTGWTLRADATLGTPPAGWVLNDWGSGTGRPNAAGGYYESTYRAGELHCGVGGSAIESPSFTASEQHTTFTVWFSPNYRVHTGAEKLWYQSASGGPVVLNIYQTARGMQPIGIRTPGGVFDPQWTISSGAAYQKGVWHTVEIYQRANSAGRADGVLRYWIDGMLAMDRSDWQYGSGAVTFLNARFDGTRGGGCDGNGPLAADQSRRYGRVSVWTR